MCMSSPSPPPPPPERQAMQAPKDDYNKFNSLNAKRRRGLWASIFTSPQGVAGLPTVTGTTGGITGG
jgi:hypothetical protein